MTLSMMSTRKAFGQSLLKIGSEDSKIVALDADLSKSTQSIFFAQKYPERFFEMGICEANMIGVSSGLALSGYKPFACSFACFITGRFDQIKMSIAYQGANVCLVGTHAGIGIGEDGYSQQGLEDVALMRSLHNMTVLQPADEIETKSMMEYLKTAKTPSYLRLTRQDLVKVHDDSYVFSLGKYSCLAEGSDVAIFASGGTVYNAMLASKELLHSNISASVYNASSLKPIDDETIIKAAKKYKLIVSVEDHAVHGGLFSAICEKIATQDVRAKVIPIAIIDAFGESGDPEQLYKKHGLDYVSIAKKVIANFVPN